MCLRKKRNLWKKRKKMHWKWMSVPLHNLKEEGRGRIEMFHYVIISLSEGKAREKECYCWIGESTFGFLYKPNQRRTQVRLWRELPPASCWIGVKLRFIWQQCKFYSSLKSKLFPINFLKLLSEPIPALLEWQ